MFNIADKHAVQATLVAVLTMCAEMGTHDGWLMGKKAQSLISKDVLAKDVVLVTALIAMHSKCRQPAEALRLWHQVSRHVHAQPHISNVHKHNCAIMPCNPLPFTGSS